MDDAERVADLERKQAIFVAVIASMTAQLEAYEGVVDALWGVIEEHGGLRDV